MIDQTNCASRSGLVDGTNLRQDGRPLEMASSNKTTAGNRIVDEQNQVKTIIINS